MASLPAEQSFVGGPDDADATWIEAAVLEVTVHDEGDRHARVQVVEDDRAARATPRRDTTAGNAGPVDLNRARVFQCKAEAPPDVEADQPIGTVSLDFEQAFAAGA